MGGGLVRTGAVEGLGMSAIFNFEALLLVLLLAICTATFLKDQPIVGPRMEANKFGCVPVAPPSPPFPFKTVPKMFCAPLAPEAQSAKG